jgi:SAM-dependent methyltransferase
VYSFENHYTEVLNKYYTKVFGGRDLNYKKAFDLFADFQIMPKVKSIAFDLGAGSGFYSIPLAKMGYTVFAIDLNNELLSEIRNGRVENIKIINDDILHFEKYSNQRISLVICMTDVISHLNSSNEIGILFNNISGKLGDEGKFLFSYRDQTREKLDTERIIPFYADDELILTTFIDVLPEKLKVFDLIYEKVNGEWITKSSVYWRLRMYSEKIKEILRACNLKIEKELMIKEMTFSLCSKMG